MSLGQLLKLALKLCNYLVHYAILPPKEKPQGKEEVGYFLGYVHGHSDAYDHY
jgi:hypothetical protein